MLRMFDPSELSSSYGRLAIQQIFSPNTEIGITEPKAIYVPGRVVDILSYILILVQGNL